MDEEFSAFVEKSYGSPDIDDDEDLETEVCIFKSMTLYKLYLGHSYKLVI